MQNLLVAELGDILKLQIECGQCGLRMAHDPKTAMILPERCPGGCDGRWHDRNSTLDQQVVDQFIQALREAIKQQTTNTKGLRIQLVFEQPKSSA